MKFLCSYKYTFNIKKRTVSYRLELNIYTIHLTKDLYAKYIFKKSYKSVIKGQTTQ